MLHGTDATQDSKLHALHRMIHTPKYTKSTGKKNIGIILFLAGWNPKTGRLKLHGGQQLLLELMSSNICIQISGVPEYLRCGEYFRSFCAELDDQQIEIPSDVLKPDLFIRNPEDLECVFKSLRFWGVDEILNEVLTFILLDSDHLCDAVLSEFEQDFCYLKAVRTVRDTPMRYRMQAAIKVGILEIVRYMHNHGYSHIFACDDAASSGHINCLKYLHANGYKLTRNSCSIAAEGGNLECVEYILQNGGNLDCKCSAAAAREGHLNLLQYLHDQGCPWDISASRAAASMGHMKILEYLVSTGGPLDVTVCLAAVGKLPLLQYLHNQGCPWDSRAVSQAVHFGHLDCLQYLLEQGCPRSDSACTIAARYGYLDCLQYLHEHGCPWDEDTCAAAAGTGKLDCLQYAHQQGCAMETSTVREAMIKNKLECFQYALFHGCPCDQDALMMIQSSSSSDGGHSDCDKLLRQYFASLSSC